MVKSIRVNSEYEALIRNISGSSDAKSDASFDNSETRIFPNRYQLIRFAGALGFRLEKREAMKKDNFLVIEQSLLEGKSFKDLVTDINLIAVLEKNDEELLDTDPENIQENLNMRFEIYLEFVNAGLNQVNKWINKGPIQGHVKIIEGLRKKKFIPNNKKEKSSLSDNPFKK